MEDEVLAGNIIRQLIQRHQSIPEIINRIQDNDRIGGRLTRGQIVRLIRNIQNAEAAGNEMQQSGSVDLDALPVNPNLDARFEYVVLMRVVCPDGSDDAYPVHVLSDELLGRDAVIASANAILNGLIGQKYQRLAKWDIDNRTGRKCTQTATIVEVWRGRLD